jgi:hypothetical protein
MVLPTPVTETKEEARTMTTAVMVLPTPVTETKEEDQLRGTDLSDLLARAAVERDIERAAGVTDDLELEAVYDVQTGVWTVQVFNHTTGAGKSLYQAS